MNRFLFEKIKKSFSENVYDRQVQMLKGLQAKFEDLVFESFQKKISMSDFMNIGN